MPHIKSEIVSIKKLKKDGSLDLDLIKKIQDNLINNKIVLLPVDSIYGIIGLLNNVNIQEISTLTGCKTDDIVRMISSFKMLDEISIIDKLEFDFLHRIWPGESIVYLKDIKDSTKAISVRIPRNKYMQDIINSIGKPLLFQFIYDNNKINIYKKKSILDSFENKVDLMILIDEFCKEHPQPTIVDICKGSLNIINEGRVSADEIKSLYFLGRDDSVE